MIIGIPYKTFRAIQRIRDEFPPSPGEPDSIDELADYYICAYINAFFDNPGEYFKD